MSRHLVIAQAVMEEIVQWPTALDGWAKETAMPLFCATIWTEICVMTMALALCSKEPWLLVGHLHLGIQRKITHLENVFQSTTSPALLCQCAMKIMHILQKCHREDRLLSRCGTMTPTISSTALAMSGALINMKNQIHVTRSRLFRSFLLKWYGYHISRYYAFSTKKSEIFTW